MEEFRAKAASFKENAREYVQTYGELAKARVTKGASTAVSGIVIAVVAGFFAFFCLFFLGFGLGWWLGTAIDNMAAGFFLVAVLFLLLTVVLFALRKKVIVPMIRNMIIKKVYE